MLKISGCSRLLFILPYAFLIGCAAPAYVIEDSITSGSQGSAAVVIIDDQRPESDGEHSIGSILITSDNYGIWTLGDAQFSPPVPELIKTRLLKNLAARKQQPARVTIKLHRCIIQANHQADLISSVSSTMTPLASAIAETMHGKDFEKDLNKTKPYILGFIDADVEVVYPDRSSFKKRLSLSKAENFSSHMDEPGRKAAAMSVIRSLLDEFSNSIKK